ncbi:MAG: hypothetical protein L0220_24810 [Acidobacteria bacterium]|nr:hypothetical protein [Acidobacteriota bacterium]
MWRIKQNRYDVDHQKLDRLGEKLLEALEVNENDIKTAATSPFLYRRIRVRIESEERRITEDFGQWVALLNQARHAVPLMVMIAAIASGIVWYTPKPINQSSTQNSVTQGIGVLNGELTGLSSEDIMAGLIDWDERKEQQ